jgi:cephalosporin hydroxylase
MKLIIDTDQGIIEHRTTTGIRRVPLYSREGFELLSNQWLKIGWDQKYPYTFTWLGRPIIQLPEDIIRIQELIYHLRPDVVVETGVAHGGSLILYASILKALGHGRVIGIDIDIRPPNRQAIEGHLLASLITLVEGSSVDPTVVQKVKSLMAPQEIVLVVLDSNHSTDHVQRELEAYNLLVPVGSYIVATDGIMRDLHDVPRGKQEWRTDNPTTAIKDFVKHHPEFVIEQPPRPFDESSLSQNLTYWPDAFLRRIR